MAIELIPHRGGGSTVACENLRPTPDGEALRPVGQPSIVTSGSWRPLCSMVDADGAEALLLHRGRELRIVDDSADTLFSAELAETPLCAVALDESMIVMTSTRRWSMTRLVDEADTWSLTEIVEPRTPLSLTAVDLPETSRYVAPIGLSGVYTARSSRLESADTRALASTLGEAYSALCADAAADGALVQPVIGFYRVMDGEGREVYRSCPTVLGPSRGLNCIDRLSAPLTTADSAEQQTAGFNIPYTPYRVALRLCRGANDLLERAASVEVWLTPQMHPVDPAGTQPSRIESGSQGLNLSFFMPGASRGMSAFPASRAADAIALLGALDEAARPQWRSATASLALSRPGDTVYVAPASSPSVADERALCRRYASRRPASVPEGVAASLAERCRPPHSFTASRVARHGDTLIWGSILPRLWSGQRGYEPGRDVEMAYATVTATVEVPENADFTQLMVATDTAQMAAPTTIAPLVCYPLAEATAMTLTVEAGGAPAKRLRLSLRTIPGCRYAFWLNPMLTPLPVDSGQTISGAAVPQERRSEGRAEGALVTAEASQPFAPCGASALPGAAIASIVPAPRAEAGWSIATPRFYLFTSLGAHSLAVDSSRRPGTPVLLRRGCFVPGNVAAAEGRMLAVDAAGSLVAFAGTRASTVARNVAAVGYSTAADELWVAMTSGETRVYPGTDLHGYYTRPGLTVRQFYGLSGRLLALVAGGDLADLGAERPQLETAVRLVRRERTRGSLWGLELMMQGEGLRGKVGVAVDGGVAPGRSVTTLTVDGNVKHPVIARIPAPRRPYATVTLSLTAGPEFTITDVALLSKEP